VRARSMGPESQAPPTRGASRDVTWRAPHPTDTGGRGGVRARRRSRRQGGRARAAGVSSRWRCEGRRFRPSFPRAARAASSAFPPFPGSPPPCFSRPSAVAEAARRGEYRLARGRTGTPQHPLSPPASSSCPGAALSREPLGTGGSSRRGFGTRPAGVGLAGAGGEPLRGLSWLRPSCWGRGSRPPPSGVRRFDGGWSVPWGPADTRVTLCALLVYSF